MGTFGRSGLMANTVAFGDVLRRAGFMYGATPAAGMLTAANHAELGANAGRHSFLFNRARTPVAVDGLFKTGGSPVILFIDATAQAVDDRALGEWHGLAWNFGIAPLLWINAPDRVVLMDSYRAPTGALADVVISEFSTLDVLSLNELVMTCGRLAFDTGAFWGSSMARGIDRQGRVDAVLLRQLAALERELRRAGLEALLAQKLIGRAIFSQYLIDRGILKRDILAKLFGHDRLSDLLRNYEKGRQLFGWLRETFNGDLFPPDIEHREDLMTEEHLAMTADFLDGHDAQSGQLGAFPFRFDIIPVELISSIYEQFAHSAAGNAAAAQGLHYTPVNLVDLTLDQTMDRVAPQARVLDPACGSGVFLVEAMRRLVWQRTRTEPNSRWVVRDVLRNQIFGVDINEGALQVAAFSLYLAALELDPDVEVEDLGWLRFDQLIGRNLLHASFLDPDTFRDLQFDVIVGNPPWTYAGAAKEKADASARPVQPRRSPDWGFLWRARELSASGAQVALLMKATPFFSKERAATAARRLMLASFSEVKLINLSQLRQEGLFPALALEGRSGQKSNAGPALLFRGRSSTSGDSDFVEVANVPWSPHFKRNGILGLTSDDFRQAANAEVRNDPVLFKAAFFANRREYEVIRALQGSASLTRLGAWCADNGISMEQGLQVGGCDEQDSSSLVGLPYLDASSYTPVEIGVSKLSRFKHIVAHRPRNRAIYRGPLVLCPESGFAGALQRGRYSAAISRTETVFNDSFVGISFADGNPLLAEALTLVLNSKLVAMLLALGGSNTGLKQPKVEKVDLEALALPDLAALPEHRLRELGTLLHALRSRPSAHDFTAADDAVMDLYDVPRHDRRVIDDILTRSRPIFNDSRHEREVAIAPLTPKILDEYGCELAHWLDTALRETSSARAIVTRGIRLTRDVIALQIDIQTGPIRPLGVFAIEQPDLFHASLLEEAEDRLLAKFKSGRNMRIYTAKTIYIVKPDEKRFWTVSDAQTDMCSIIDDVQKRVANAPILAHWRLESKPSVGLTFH